MAGIGISLNRILHKDSYAATLRAYGYAGLISAGPWVMSILGIIVLGAISTGSLDQFNFVTPFQTSVTYLIATSLVLSGLLQHSFTRFVSDLVFLDRPAAIFPNLLGAITLTSVFSGVTSLTFCLLAFPETSIVYRCLMSASFVVLCNIWITVNLLSGLKAYRTILMIFFLAYGITVGLGYFLRTFGLEGLLFSFFTGHVLLLFGALGTLFVHSPATELVRFDFLERGKLSGYLMGIGVLYNLGIWADKAVFWAHPLTSNPVIGPLRASIIYDLPIFIAYLSIIPGMAVFLIRLETDIAEAAHNFYQSFITGASLNHLRAMRNQLVVAARQSIFSIVKVQSITVLIFFVCAPALLRWLHLPSLYSHLLYVDLVSAALQVVLLSLLNIYFYMDKQKHALVLTGFFVITNIVFSTLSIQMGAYFFGYGFALSLLGSIALGMWLLDRNFEALEYETMMLTT